MIARIGKDEKGYPKVLRDRMGDEAPSCLHVIGDPAILRHRLLGLVCSVRCPGSIVIKTFDAIRALRDAGVAVVGGFHSPMEKECLGLLLRGDQPVVLCPARGLAGLCIGKTAKIAVDQGRLLVVSPFARGIRRATAPLAAQRNHLVAALADALWVPHAVPGGKTWATVTTVLARHQPVFTFAGEDNAGLLDAGARIFAALDVPAFSARPEPRAR